MRYGHFLGSTLFMIVVPIKNKKYENSERKDCRIASAKGTWYIKKIGGERGI